MGEIPKSFVGDWQARQALDDSGSIPTGSEADTYYSADNRLKATAEQLDILNRLENGEIDRFEADTLLDMLASNTDL